MSDGPAMKTEVTQLHSKQPFQSRHSATLHSKQNKKDPAIPMLRSSHYFPLTQTLTTHHTLFKQQREQVTSAHSE